MIRHCGRCGTSLTAEALQAGRCAQCGAAIDYSGGTLGPDVAPPGDTPTRLMERASAAIPATDAAATRSSTDAIPVWQPVERGWPYVAGSPGALQVGPHVTRPQATRQTRWALALFLAVPLVLVATSILVLTQTGILAFLAPPSSAHHGATSGATASASAAGATSTAATISQASTQSPVSGPTPSVIASPSPSASESPQGSPVPGPAYLSVSATTINVLLCGLQQSRQFTVANKGGATMQWSASTSEGYVIDPGSGTINAGGKQTVTVKRIVSSGTVTVTAPNAANSPQKVTISCLP
jgi:hypothetical protein